LQTDEIIMDRATLEQPRARKIFMVEDDKDIVAIYKEALEQQGFCVDSAEDGLRAIKMVKALQPDVIILDLLMPKLNGVDVVKYVRANADTAKIPIIIFSNAFMSDLVQRAADAGANIGLLKSSCTPNKLIGVINNVLAGDEFDTKHMSLLAAPLRDKRDAPKLFNTPAPEVPKAPPATLFDQPDERKRGLRTEMRHAFTVTEAHTIGEMRALWQNVLMHESAGAQKMAMMEIWTKLRSVNTSATAAGCVYIARFAGALEGLLRELNSEPNNINYSRMLTVAEGIDFLKYLFNATGGMNFGSPDPSSVMLVDPDIEFAFSLERAMANFNMRLIQATDAATASMLLENQAFELIMMEANLPDASGFNFCLRTRSQAAHSKTPVFFLSENLDIDSRPHAVLCGGKEIIAKPLLASEVIVKALMQIMRDEINAASD
jgi:DNA-binding response OmpR family regulator